MPNLIDRNGVLLHPVSGSRIHPDTELSEQDATAALLLLAELDYDMLIFGWEDDGEFWDVDRGSQKPIREV